MLTTVTESAPSAPEQPTARAARAKLVTQLVPCVLLLCVWLAVIPPSGGYFPRTWYPVALASVLLFYVFRVTGRATVAPGRPLRCALVLFAALVAWAFLSILWAGSPGSAWEAANKLVLLLAMAGIAAVVPWTKRSLALLLGGWALGVAVLCASRLIVWLSADDLARFFEPASGRMDDPLGYPNATAALPAMALVPALLLSAVREVPVWVRAAALPVAVFLAEFSLFAQSRGAVVGAAAALVVLVALAGERLRLLLRLAVMLAIAVPAVGPVIDVGNAAIDGVAAGPPLDHAAKVIALTTLVAAAVGLALALADERVRVPARVVRASARGVAVLLLVVAVGAALAYGGRARTWAHDAWVAGSAPSGETSRLLSLAPEERPDYARVAFDLFAEHPVAGVGTGNFGREYDARRRFDKHSRFAHDIWLRQLSEQGIVGIVLLVGMLGALGVGVVVRRRTQDAFERSLVAACFAVGAYLLAHGSLDWLEEFPALALPAVGLPFAALAMGVPRPRGRPATPAWRHNAQLAAGGIVLGAVLASLVPAWISVRYVDRAHAERATNPAAAFADYDRAGRWNPLSTDPAIGEGALALSLGQRDRARAAFFKALRRERNWFSYLELALLHAQEGRFDTARTTLAKAAALSRNDLVIAGASRVIARRQRVDPTRVNELALQGPLFRRLRMP